MEGYWYVSYDNGSSWTQLGKATGENGNDGKDGVDGDSMFSKVTYDDEFVYLVLADNVTTLTIPRKVNDFDLQFEGGNNLACSSGETVSVKYTLTYGNANTEVAAIPHGGWEAKVEETDNASGIITVTAPNPMKDGEVIVLASDGTGKTVMKKLIFDEGVVTIATKSYVVDSKQTTISVELSTNLDYTVSIPDDAKSWISVSDIQTKSTMRNDVVSLNIVANTDNPTRTANISFVNSANEILNTISILQTSSTIANNEIWYTSSDGNIIEPNNFSGNIVSNMYGNGKGVIVFEDNLTEIWESAFKECSNLKRITIPNTVTSIGTTAFWRCFNLEEVEIPTNVSTIEDGAFFDCNSLIRITIPENVTSIDCCLFFCSGLIEFTIHSNVTSICCGAFSGCNNLEALYCCPVIPPTYERAEYGDIDDIGISVKTKIYVPTESVEQYKSAEGWSQYASQIVGYDFSE